MARGPRSRQKLGLTKVWVSIGLALVAPLLTFAAVLLVRNRIFPLEVGLDILTLQVAQWGSFVAVAFALLSVMLSLGQFQRLGLVTLLVLAASVAIAGAFILRSTAMAMQGPLDVTTDLAEPPAVSGRSGAPQTCSGLTSIPRQVAPETATEALQAAGFSVTESQLFRSRGVRSGFWFGLRHEAVVRIRPGRTDVRVVARYDRADGGETCRVAGNLVAGLQAGR